MGQALFAHVVQRQRRHKAQRQCLRLVLRGQQRLRQPPVVQRQRVGGLLAAQGGGKLQPTQLALRPGLKLWRRLRQAQRGRPVTQGGQTLVLRGQAAC